MRDKRTIFDVKPSGPGPGEYNNEEVFIHSKKEFSKPFQSAFGSSDSRKIENP